MGRGKQVSEAELKEIRNFLAEGLSHEEIGELLGKSRKAITNIVSRHGLSRGRYKQSSDNLFPDWKTTQTEEVKEPVHESTETTVQEQETKPVENMIPDFTTALKPAVKPVAEKTLKDFSPREIIRYLFKDLGYSIENNELVCYVKQKVNLNDIIKNG